MKKGIYKILSFALAMMLVFSAAVFAEEGAELAFTAETIVLEQGEGMVEVEFPISFEGDVKVTALEAEVNFDEDIEFIGFAEGDSLAGIVEPKTGKNPVVLIFLDATVQGVEMKSGTFATLKFKVPVDKAIEYEIDFSITAVADEKYEDIDSKFFITDGKIIIEKSEINDFEDEIETEDKEDNKIEDEKVQEIIPEIENDKVPEIKPEQEKEDVVEETPEKEEELTSAKRGEDVVCLRIDTPLAYVRGKYLGIDEANSKVVPYIVNDRTLVPLRFVSENLGAEVLWEDGWEYCFVNKGDKKIKITFGSADIEVNGKVITYEAPVEVVEDRTMVPIRFISEELGYHVYWNEANSAVAITPIENPWVESRKAENDLLLDVLMTFLMKGIL